MNTVFIGGSRRVSRLPARAKERLKNVIDGGHRIIVGDANGADKAVQKFLVEASYESVTVFCSGERFRNNLGRWPTHNVLPPTDAKGFQFYAAKDREMAQKADFGLMIWDGKSAGTVLNVLRLIRAGKKAVLLNVKDEQAITFKALADWDDFLLRCSNALRKDLLERATYQEWIPGHREQTGFFDPPEEKAGPTESPAPRSKTGEELEAETNKALASGDPASALDALRHMAEARGIRQVADDARLAPARRHGSARRRA